MSAETITSTSTATISHVFVAWPEGKRIRGRVKEIEGVESFPDEVHPDGGHGWHEMLHYGQPGTGFASCRCGAVGVPYRRRYR